MNTRQVEENLNPRGNNAADGPRLTEMRRLYEVERWTLAEIGKTFGISRQRVQQILVKAGIESWPSRRRREVVPTTVIAEMRRLYEDEVLSIREIAARFAIPQGVARKRLIEAGTKIYRTQRSKIRIEAELLQALYERKGLSLASIEAKIGICRNIVAREMARHGIPTRPRYIKKATAQGGRI